MAARGHAQIAIQQQLRLGSRRPRVMGKGRMRSVVVWQGQKKMAWRARALRWLCRSRCAGCDVLSASDDGWCGPCRAATQLQVKVGAVASAAVTVFAGARYAGPIITAVQNFKYRARPDLASTLALLAHAAAKGHGAGATLVPIPLHPRRLVERGYNQAGLLAAALSRLRSAEVDYDVLQRLRDTPRQAQLDRRHRLGNVSAAFGVSKRAGTLEEVLLVDDVVTTGATLSAAAEALRAAGVARVAAVTVAAVI